MSHKSWAKEKEEVSDRQADDLKMTDEELTEAQSQSSYVKDIWKRLARVRATVRSKSEGPYAA